MNGITTKNIAMTVVSTSIVFFLLYNSSAFAASDRLCWGPAIVARCTCCRDFFLKSLIRAEIARWDRNEKIKMPFCIPRNLTGSDMKSFKKVMIFNKTWIKKVFGNCLFSEISTISSNVRAKTGLFLITFAFVYQLNRSTLAGTPDRGDCKLLLNYFRGNWDYEINGGRGLVSEVVLFHYCYQRILKICDRAKMWTNQYTH